MLLDYNKNDMFQNIVFFVLLLLIMSKVNITLQQIYSLIFAVIIWYIYYYFTNENTKIQVGKMTYIKKFINGDNHFDNHHEFIDFIHDNKRFESSKNYKEFINIINEFLKIYNESHYRLEIQKVVNYKDLYKNAMNTYQSLIYLIGNIDNNYQDNLSKLENIFLIYLSNLNDIEKDDYNENNINYLSKPHEDNIIEGLDKTDTFNFF
jgi:hypothetical protein